MIKALEIYVKDDNNNKKSGWLAVMYLCYNIACHQIQEDCIIINIVKVEHETSYDFWS